MRTTLVLLALVTGTAAVAQTAPSAPPPQLPRGAMGHGPGMMRADANRDGVLTRAEAIADATRRFDRMDANHDGRIDQPEMDAARQRRMMRRGGEMASPPSAAPID